MTLSVSCAVDSKVSAASWAEARGVAQIVRRHDELLNLLPTGAIAFPGSGITGNLLDKPKHLGVPVMSGSTAAFQPRQRASR